MDDYLQYVGGTFGLAAITGAAAATALYMAYSPTPMYPNIDINSQSLEVPVCILLFLFKVLIFLWYNNNYIIIFYDI